MALTAAPGFSAACRCPASLRPLGIFPPAPMRRSPGHTLMLCGLFCVAAVWVGINLSQPKSMWMTSNWSSLEPSGARARFAAALTAMRLLWLMTSVVSGHVPWPAPAWGTPPRDPQPLHEVEDAGGYQPGPTYGNKLSSPAARPPRAQRRRPGAGSAGGGGALASPLRLQCATSTPTSRAP